MTVSRPYRRTFRQFIDGDYFEGGRSQYVTHAKYAQAPSHYVRAFLLLLKDLQDIFDYVEPDDTNGSAYSYRIHALLLRACIEVEANCKAILKENGYSKGNDKRGKEIDMKMDDYKKIEKTHALSQYQVKIPYWNGTKEIRTPFSQWSTGQSLPWYTAYNATKHDRYVEFRNATFDNLLDACCGVFVLLSAQFGTHDFAPTDIGLSVGGPNDGMESGIGDYLRVKFPDNLPMELRYDFNWQSIKNEPDPFEIIDYSKI